jgi:ribosome recycling factor
MLEGVYKDIRERMEKTVETAGREFGRIRTGRATPALLDGIMIDAYGSKMPLNQVATISVPQPRLLKLQPFDKTNMSAIEKAIMTSDLGINPRNDGHSVIVEIPTLSEERREELAKRVRKHGEEMKVAIRNVRRDGNDELKMIEEEKEISEDDLDRGLKKVQEITDDYIKKIDDLVDKKEKEIREF